ncbi:unnamed protein product [Cunninghamella blakesleeana]
MIKRYNLLTSWKYHYRQRSYYTTVTSSPTTSTTTTPPSSPPQPPQPKFSPRQAKPPESTKIDAPYHFYQNKVLEPYLKEQIHVNSVRQYILFGKQMNNERLITSANWVRNELLVRLAHRIRDFQQLPFIVGANPNIEWPYRLYWGAFETLRKSPIIKSKQDNLNFCHLLQELLEDGQYVLPTMALGVSECSTSRFQTSDHVLDGFLNRMIRSRVSRRLLAEQHIALTKACYGSDDDKMALNNLALKYVNPDKKRMNDQQIKKGNKPRTLQVGIFNSECSATAIFNQAKLSVTKQLSSLSPLPSIDLYIQDNDDITFAYIPEQLEHILYELLSNSIKYTIQQHDQEHDKKKKENDSLPPVKVTICANKTDIFFRVSDQACGIKPNVYQRLWSYQERAASGDFNDFQVIRKMPATMAERMKLEQQNNNHNHNNNNGNVNDKQMGDLLSSDHHHQQQQKDHVTLGIGLIMSRIFAEYFGGELQVMTLEGYGTDVYVRIPRLGSHTENLGIDLKHRHQHHHHQQQQHHHHHHQQQLKSQNKINQHHPSSFTSTTVTTVTDSTSQLNIKTKHHLSRQSLEPKEGWSSSSMIIS